MTLFSGKCKKGRAYTGKKCHGIYVWKYRVYYKRLHHKCLKVTTKVGVIKHVRCKRCPKGSRRVEKNCNRGSRRVYQTIYFKRNGRCYKKTRVTRRIPCCPMKHRSKVSKCSKCRRVTVEYWYGVRKGKCRVIRRKNTSTFCCKHLIE